MIKNLITIVLGIVALSLIYAFVVPNLAHAAATMQNDTESIALPTAANDKGEQVTIFDNPDLIEQWAQGATNYTDYYANLGATFTVTSTGTGVVSVGSDTTAATGESFVSFLGTNSGVTYSPRTTPVSNSGSNGSIVIVGSKLRQALIAKGLSSLTIKGWDFDDTQFIDDSEYYETLASFDSSDLAVVASAIVFKNQDIQEVSIQGERLSVTYIARGHLFWIIPISFTVRLTINTGGKTDAERVALKYPWYRVFVSLPVSPNALAANLNASIVGIQAAGLNTEAAQAKLFTYVSNLLQAGGATQVSGLPTQ